MATGVDPLIKLSPDGQGPVLTHSLPEPSVYFGRHYVELEHDASVFGATATVVLEEAGAEKIAVIKAVRDLTSLGLKEAKNLVENAPQPVLIAVAHAAAQKAKAQLEEAGATVAIRTGAAEESLTEEVPLSSEELPARVAESMRTGFADRSLFPRVRLAGESLRVVPREGGGAQVVSTLPVSEELSELSADEIARHKENGQELAVYRSLHGELRHRYVPQRRSLRPRILLVETFRMGTYLGAYGAGKVLKTVTLFPGERMSVNVRTFRKTEQERKEASSILDSFTEESARDFEEKVAAEQTSQARYEESFEYDVEASAKAGWGWGSASVKGGVRGGTNAAREEAAKNTTSAVNKQAQTASAKREVQVDTSTETGETLEEERTSKREIENINVSRTLNFVFRQMNQEFITVLSLVDVRVAYFNGTSESRDEVALPELDALLERHLVSQERDAVRSDIEKAVGTVLDADGNLHQDFVEERVVADQERYLRVRTEKVSEYLDPLTGTKIKVPGVVLAVTKNVMRTDGVVAESLLGVGDALDEYSSKLQQLEIEQRQAAVAREQALMRREELANTAIGENDADRVGLVNQMSVDGCSGGPFELRVRRREDTDREPTQ